MRSICQVLVLGVCCLFTPPLAAQAPMEFDPWIESGFACQDDCGLAAQAWPGCRGRPGAGLSVKSGYVSPLGGGFYEERIDGGWSIDFNLRQMIGSSWQTDCLSFFAEYGGSYSQLSGNELPAVTSGSYVVRGFNAQGAEVGVPISAELDELAETGLRRLIYGGVQAALGTMWYPYPMYRDFYFTTSSGLRWGRAGASYSETETPELQAAIADAEELLKGTFNAVTTESSFDSNARTNDAYFGIYATVGMGVSLSDFVFFDAQVSFDTLWINLGDFGRNDSSLGTVSALGAITVLY